MKPAKFWILFAAIQVGGFLGLMLGFMLPGRIAGIAGAAGLVALLPGTLFASIVSGTRATGQIFMGDAAKAFVINTLAWSLVWLFLLWLKTRRKANQ